MLPPMDAACKGEREGGSTDPNSRAVTSPWCSPEAEVRSEHFSVPGNLLFPTFGR